MLFTLAWRNLRLHRTKNLLVGLMMAVGVVVLFVGNTLIETAVSGLETVFRRGYTADLMVSGPSDRPVTVFATDSLGGEDGSVPPLLGATELSSWIAALPGVEAVGGQLGTAADLGRDEQVYSQVPLMGIDREDEQRLFPDRVVFLEGTWPWSTDRAWVLLSESARDRLARESGRPVKVGDPVMVGAVGEAAGTVIRELVVRGVIRFRHSHPDLNLVSLAPADTVRDLLGFASLADGAPALTEDQQAFVDGFDPEALFAQAPEVAEGQVSVTPQAVHPVAVEPAWQFLLIRTSRGADLGALKQSITDHLAQTGVPGRVQGWVEGAGPVAIMALSVGWVFDGLVALVAVVMLLITMNALVISITERSAELGTMRALGAQKTFVLRLIGAETTLLVTAATAVGLMAGWVLLQGLRQIGVPAPNLFFEALFGGPVLIPVLSWAPVVNAVVAVAGLAALSVWYPARLALGIPPSTAMAAGREAS